MYHIERQPDISGKSCGMGIVLPLVYGIDCPTGLRDIQYHFTCTESYFSNYPESILGLGKWPAITK